MANELNAETLNVALTSIDEFAARELPDSLLIDLDERDVFPEELGAPDVVRRGAGYPAAVRAVRVRPAWEAARSTSIASASGWLPIDLGLATSELATFLGSDPIRVGGTRGPEARVHGPDRE